MLLLIVGLNNVSQIHQTDTRVKKCIKKEYTKIVNKVNEIKDTIHCNVLCGIWL